MHRLIGDLAGCERLTIVPSDSLARGQVQGLSEALVFGVLLAWSCGSCFRLDGGWPLQLLVDGEVQRPVELQIGAGGTDWRPSEDD